MFGFLKTMFVWLTAALWLCALSIMTLFVILHFFPGAISGLGVAHAIEARASAATHAAEVTDPIASPVDLMALLLTVVTIVLALVAFLIAVGAFFGYGALKEFTEATVREKFKPIKSDLDEAITSSRNVLEMDRAKFESWFAEMGRVFEGEQAEGQGLPGGSESDKIAEASGNLPSAPP